MNTDKLNVPEEKKTPTLTFQHPTEIVELPSKGLCYPKDNNLSSGEVEIYFPDTSHEEILMSKKLIKNGTAIDKFLKSIIKSDVNFNDLILGDKSAIMIASRILMYGKDYNVKQIDCNFCGEHQETTFDLTEIKDKEINYKALNRDNVYTFELPMRKQLITFKLLTHKDEVEIANKIKFNKALNKKDDIDREYSIRLNRMILSVQYKDENGNEVILDSVKDLKMFKMLSIDGKAFKTHLTTITPDIDSHISYECKECGEINTVILPMTVDFFWPTL